MYNVQADNTPCGFPLYLSLRIGADCLVAGSLHRSTRATFACPSAELHGQRHERLDNALPDDEEAASAPEEGGDAHGERADRESVERLVRARLLGEGHSTRRLVGYHATGGE